MARRKSASRREVLPDPLFCSELLAKFINAVMRHGKKSVAEGIVYGALGVVIRKQEHTSSSKGYSVKEKNNDSSREHENSEKSGWLNEEIRFAALGVFKKALDNVMPSVEVKSRRVGGSTYQIPVEIRAVRRQALAMRWLSKCAKARNEKTMTLRLANEILDAVEQRGGSIKKKEDMHRMAKANQAFAHYRW
ncbi:30S ribosomal protein S7 [Coxiella endosymbiont of Amblyomma americanum]|uniref:30S ribosomal protein S7 n=1 Tax=Coxiella endosymbiont of Amblyomma americanum TaxID=325775 RepID=UPI00057EF1C7|nr:30S ribosomal protein S7 [Coxiella endosymbiont of Amblyomma americanum]AJC50419.1 30S ribosomal protein S7 [Coxiella endosymbiont of Amblyomma americanum]AUJ58759.1 30S ribosomal protein S7 [Coxiella-like endosymbiont of Amblyomma americanum]